MSTIALQPILFISMLSSLTASGKKAIEKAHVLYETHGLRSIVN
ncbi:hypothetical protein [Psychrobacter sp. NG27]|nr:hypothetical protein [Psychrobacter sp. NG27]